MSTIFISHNSQDNQFAIKVKDYLEQIGHCSLFLDFDPENGIPGGRNWEEELYSNLRKCKVVIALCSNNFFASNWCFAEITHARALGKYIIPMRIDDCSINSILLDVQVIDARNNLEESFKRLQLSLKAAGLELAREWDKTRSPYPGLASFQEDESAIYFGRESETQELFDVLNKFHRFGGTKLLQVVGASGSGKSSLVRAGLIPKLRQDKRSWLVIGPFRPLQEPFEGLSQAIVTCFKQFQVSKPQKAIVDLLTKDAQENDTRGKALSGLLKELTEVSGEEEVTILLFIDQFEEVLVDTNKKKESIADKNKVESASTDVVKYDQFVSYLRSFLDLSPSKVLCVGTLRSDFLGNFQESEPFKDYIFDSFMVPAITPEGLIKSITGPANVANIELGDKLVETIVKDIPNTEALPLLAFTLRELWEKHGKDSKFEVNEYNEKLGGIGGSIARAAEAVLKAYVGKTGKGKIILSERNGAVVHLNTEEEIQLRNAFMAMVQVNEEGKYIRQLASKKDFPATIHDLLKDFENARLLMPYRDSRNGGDNKIEVAHEAIFRTWTRLVNWLNANRDFLLWRRRLNTFRIEFRSEVLRGTALAEAREWQAKHESGEFKLKKEEIEFISHSYSIAKQEEIKEEKRRKRELRNSRLVIAGAGLVIIIILVSFFFIQKQNTKIQKQLVITYWNSSQAAVADNRALNALHFIAEAININEDNELTNNLLLYANYLLPYPVINHIYSYINIIKGAAFSPDEKIILTWSEDSTARLWDVATKKQLEPSLQHNSEVLSAVFSPDGQRILTRGYKIVQVWDVATRRQLEPAMLHEGMIRDAVFSLDGQRILTWSGDSTARHWDVNTRKQLEPAMQHNGDVRGAAFSPDGQRILTRSGDKTARLWDVNTRKQLEPALQHNGGSLGAVFSPDGQRILTWGIDSTARLWDANTRKQLEPSLQHNSEVLGAAFSPNGQRILAWDFRTRTTRLWDAATRKQLEPSLQHEGLVRSAAFSPDGQRILTWSEDGTARLWNVATRKQLGPAMLHEGGTLGAVFSLNGQRILTWDYKTVRVWDATRKKFESSLQHSGEDLDAVFSPDEKIILTWSEDGAARLWDVATREQLEPTMQHNGSVWGAAFSPDGQRILTWSMDRTARLWDVATRKQLGPAMLHEDMVRNAAFSPNGQRILTRSDDNTVQLWKLDIDYDIPSTLFKLQAQATTGTQLNTETSEIKTIEPKQLLELKKEFYQEAREHYKICKYPEHNLWAHFFREEAKELRPKVKVE